MFKQVELSSFGRAWWNFEIKAKLDVKLDIWSQTLKSIKIKNLKLESALQVEISNFKSEIWNKLN